MIPVFSGTDVRVAVSPERALEAVREAFIAYARGEWTMPPKVYVPAYPAGDFRAMPALGGGHALLKWVTSFPGNPAHGLPTVTGLVLLGSSLALARRGGIYRTALTGQLALLGAAAARPGLPRYYTLVTWATVKALRNYLREGVPAVWEKAEGTR